MSISNHKVFTALTKHPVTAGMERLGYGEYEDSVLYFAYDFHRSSLKNVPYTREDYKEDCIYISDQDKNLQEMIEEMTKVRDHYDVTDYDFLEGYVQLTVKRELTCSEKEKEDERYRNSVKAIEVLEEIYKEL